MPSLTVQLPGLPPVSHVLKDQTITIGRMKGNTIVIEDSSVSLMHARISLKDGEVLLKDLNSTNGTTVNGQPVNEVKLKDLDRIGFADVQAQFQTDAARENAATIASRLEQATKKASALAEPAPARKADETPVVPNDPSRTTNVVSAIAGGVAALVVLALIGWRLFHLDENSKRTSIANDSMPAGIRKAKRSTSVSTPSPPELVPAESTKISMLVTHLHASDAAERRRAASQLHGLGSDAKEAAVALRDALRDPDEEVQMWAALSLVNNHVYDKAALPILVRALGNENAIVRRVVCLSLGLVPYEPAEKEIVVPTLAETAGKDPNEQVREAARSALNIIAPELLGAK